MKQIEYVGYSLMIVAYTIFLIKTLNFIVGLIMSISTIFIVLIILKYLSIYNKENYYEPNKSIDQSVGKNAKAKGNLTFKNISQRVDNKSDRQGKK